MGKQHLNRKRLKTLHHWRYQRHKSLAEGVCVYCGDTATVEDHCPALAAVDALGVAALEDADTPFWLVPACAQCNGWLGAKPFLTMASRLEHIADRWERFLDQHGTANWTPAEIAELGPGLRSTVEAHARALEVAQERLKYARRRIGRAFS